MDFVNNWSRPITLAAGAWECPLDLPDGTYRLTISDSALAAEATAWECIDAEVLDGTAELSRGLEGTTDQAWEEGSVIYCAVTAGVLADLQAQLVALAARVTALEPPPLMLLLEVEFTEATWSYGDYPLIRSVEALEGGDVVATLDISAFTQATSGVGAYVEYTEDSGGAPAVRIGYNDRLTQIATGILMSAAGDWDALRFGLDGITAYDGSCATLDGVDPRNELGSTAFEGAAGIVYVDVPLY